MMIRICALAALSLLAICGLLVMLPRVQSYDDTALNALLDLDCPPPCFMGIRPGETTAGEAMRILQNHAWVGQTPIVTRSLFDRRTFSFQWQWNGTQPTAIDARWPGMISISQNLVQSIRVRTTLPLGNVWLALGDTNQGVALFSLDRPRHRNTTYIAVYEDFAILVRSPTAWRVARREFWGANVELESTNPENIAYFGAYPYPMPCHWVCRS